ncbi:hypothetical protein Ac2012v2_004734 [Leucoagaricus gongylophorus]
MPRPTSQPPTYAEAVSIQAHSHEPVFVILTPAYSDPEISRRRNPPVHDIGAGDRLVALADINMRKADFQGFNIKECEVIMMMKI